jgi:acylphosphatase
MRRHSYFKYKNFLDRIRNSLDVSFENLLVKLNKNDNVCNLVIFSGKVQGVCFRWSVEKYANSRGINGLIWNSDDKRVFMVIMANRIRVLRLLNKINSGQVAEYATIRSIIQVYYPNDFAVDGFETIDEKLGNTILNILNEDLCHR